MLLINKKKLNFELTVLVIRLEEKLSSGSVGFLRNICGVVFWASAFLYFFPVILLRVFDRQKELFVPLGGGLKLAIAELLPVFSGMKFLSLILISFSLYMFFEAWRRLVVFFKERQITPLPPDASKYVTDPLSYCDFETFKLLLKTRADYPEEIILAILDSDFGKFFLERLQLEKNRVAAKLKSAKLEPSDIIKNSSADSILAAALKLAEKSGHSVINIGDLFLASCSLSPLFKDLLYEYKLDAKDIDYTAHWYYVTKEHGPKSLIWRLNNSDGIGKDWAYAYTPLLDKFSEPVKTGGSEETFLHYLGHKQEILRLEEALSKSAEANAVLVGEAGVGKMTIVEGFARMSSRGRAPRMLNYKRVLKLNLELLFGQKSFGDTIGLLHSILREAEWAGNLILVIDEIQNYILPQSQTNVSEILVPFLKSTKVKMIGITDSSGFARGVLENPAMANLFEKIEVPEPDEKTTMRILMDVASHKENYYSLKVSYPAIEKIYELGDQFMTETPFPEKGINLLEDAFVYARSLAGIKIITGEHVERVLERKIHLPVGEMEAEESRVLANLENELHKRLINQEQAVSAVSNALRRSRTGLAATGKPIGSFLFLGPTGVGKTETAKALAEIYFGDEKRMVRFDMSEYQKTEDLDRIIGSPKTRTPGDMAREIRENPFSLLLLDEIEKAHKDILNLFLQVLDEGRFTDAFGKRVDFRNTIIIATSNAGAEFIRESLNQGMPYSELQKKLVDKVLKDGFFRPEFVNRFDEVIVFKPLNFEELVRVSRLIILKLGQRLEKQGFRFKISDDTLKRLAKAAEGSVFGARELRRQVQDTIESPLAKDILGKKYKKGETIVL